MSLKLISNENAVSTLMRETKYTLEWIPEKNYVAGTEFELRSKSLRVFHEWRYVSMEMDGADILFRWKIRPDVSEIFANKNRAILRAKLIYGARKGQPCIIRLRCIPPLWAGVNDYLTVWTKDIKNNFDKREQEFAFEKEVNSACELVVKPAPVERLSLYSHAMPDQKNRVRVGLVPEDRHGNPSEFKETQTILLEWNGKKTQLEVKGPRIVYVDAPEKDAGRAKAYIPVGGLDFSENIQNGIKEDNHLVVTGNPVWSSRRDGLLAAFGEIHWHTGISFDGDGTMEDALYSAKEHVNINFAAPADHNPDLNNWDATVNVLDKFNGQDDFVTLYGWENATDRGHENYYFLDAKHPLICNGKAGFSGGRPDEVVEQLKKYKDFIGIAHHTNAVSETRRLEDDTPYWHPYPWGNQADYIRLAEIMQCRGNQERNEYDEPWRGWHQNNRASLQDALAMGYKLGFTGGTDNHCALPGRAYAAEEGGMIHSPKSVILTGAWVENIDRKGVYDAMWKRSTWAVWDTRAIVWFTVNGVLMGGEADIAKGEELTAHIKLSAEDMLQSVEIISDRKTVWISSFSEADIDITVSLGKACTSTYFYLRALQRNGGIIYASPVFVNIEYTKPAIGGNEAMTELLDMMPAIRYIPAYDPIGAGDIRALTYDGMPIGGKKTKVFAYIGFPDTAPKEKIPAVVLVHGGGGHAYYKWVRMWNEAGYAAIAMDTTGYYPTAVGAGSRDDGDRDMWVYGTNEDGYVSAPDNDAMKASDGPLDTQWMYHAVAGAILAGNILRADNRVDSSKIGITGISWGGVITSIVIGYDNRYAFAIPIYGAGYLSESIGAVGKLFQGEMTKKLWSAEARFDRVTMPVFWFNWNYDISFSANITSKSYRDTVKNNPLTVMSLKDKMRHSHAAGWQCRENFLFADSVIKGMVGLPRFLNQPSGRHIDCGLRIPEGMSVTANIFCLTGPMSYAYQDKLGYTNKWLMEQDWYSYPIAICDGRIMCTINDHVAGYYIELAMEMDGYRHVSTSEYVMLT